MNIKLTPLTLFLILLLVLVLSVLFSKYFPEKEGFITFAQEKAPLEPVFIPSYSSSTTTVVKLYDNAFFDMRNANLIEVDGDVVVSESGPSGNVMGNTSSFGGNVIPSGLPMGTSEGFSSISKIYVLKREEPTLAAEYRAVVSTDGTVVPVDTPESQISTTSSVFLTKMYNTKSDATDKYQIAYITWGTRTYIHLIRLGSSPKHISSYLMGENSAGHLKMYPDTTISVGPYVDDADADNGKFVRVPLYDGSANIYQLSKSVRYDQRNGNLVIFDKANNALKVYGRNGAESTSYQSAMPTSIPVSNFEPWLVNDADKNMVVYMPHDKKTLLMVLQMDPTDSSKFILGKVARFTNDGALDAGNGAAVAPSQPTPSPSTNDPMSEYYKWLSYWNVNIMYEDKNDDDYIRKTQIVPPVCPSCPSCPACAGGSACASGKDSGVCANCGGNGGSGTLTKEGTSTVKDAAPIRNVVARTVESTGDVAEKAITTTGDVLKTTGSEVSSLVRSAGSGTTDILKSTASGATDILKSTASGTTDLLKSTASGTTDLLKSTASGTTDLLKSAGSGTVDLLKSAGRGTASLLSPSHPSYRQSVIYPQGAVKRTGETQRVAPAAMYKGQGLGPSDYYSMYGATQPKGDDFIPITADFSAFRK